MDWYQVIHTVLALILAIPLLMTAVSWVKGVYSQERRNNMKYSLLCSLLLILYVILITLNNNYGPRVQMSQIFSGIPQFYYFSRLSHNILEFLICLVIIALQSRCLEKQW